MKATVSSILAGLMALLGFGGLSRTVACPDQAMAAAGSSMAAAQTGPRRAAGPCIGVVISDGEGIQAAVSSHPEGTRFCLHGVHNLRLPVVPKAGDQFL